MAAKVNKWSAKVNATSDAMDVESGTFKQKDPKKIARAVEHDAEKSNRRKTTPYRSAMSMLTFYINRAGKNLTAEQRDLLEQAKDVLRQEFGPKAGAGAPAKQRSTRGATAKKQPKRTTAAKKSSKSGTAARKKSSSRNAS